MNIRSSNHIKYSNPREWPLAMLLAVILIGLGLSSLALDQPRLASAQEPPKKTTVVDDIGMKLVCQCGCNAILTNCPEQPNCQSWASMRSTIKTQLDQGKTSDQIIALFVEKYGEKVLVEPPKAGLNLVAYIAPFAGLIGGGMLLVVLLSRWASRGKGKGGGDADAGDSTGGSSPIEQEYRRRLEKELKEMP